MKIKPVIHHHFEFCPFIIKNPEKFSHVRFESIPFFKLYIWSSFETIRKTIETLVHPMPHAYQKTFNKIRPANLECSNYREDLITLKFCKYNKQAFFVRVYYLRQNGGKFFKVEVTMHSDVLPQTKYFDWEKAYRGASNFFQFIDKDSEALSPLDLHLDEYFFPEVFQKEVNALQNSLNAFKQSNNNRVRDSLIEEFKEQAMTLQLKAKSKASMYISSLRKEAILADNLDEWRQPNS